MVLTLLKTRDSMSRVSRTLFDSLDLTGNCLSKRGIDVYVSAEEEKNLALDLITELGNS